jgi:uncharacterized coiled-coil protein SlyX
VDLERKNRAYRRALALGLTLAEIFVLLVFILLLAFATFYKHFLDLGLRLPSLQRELGQQAVAMKTLSETNKTLTEANDQLRHENDYLKSRASAPENFDDLFRELRLQQARIEQLETQLAEMKKQDAAIKVLEKVLASQPDSARDPKSILRDLALRASDAEREQRRLQGELANLQKKLVAAGHGTEMPPCWVTPDGTIEYIFDISLTSNGIVVHDNALPDHAEDEKRLAPQMRFDSVLDRDEFLRATQGLYDWSRAQHPECRFFVRVFDRTKADEKTVYKSELQTVEGHFYKLLVNEVSAAPGNAN